MKLLLDCWKILVGACITIDIPFELFNYGLLLHSPDYTLMYPTMLLTVSFGMASLFYLNEGGKEKYND